MSTEDRAVLVCHPDPSVSGSAEWTFWADLTEAQAALNELTPCGPHCIECHTAARLDSGREPRRRSSSSTRATVATRVAAAYGAGT